MSFDFNDFPGQNEFEAESPIAIAEDRKDAISAVMKSLGKATQLWKDNSKNEDVIHAIVNATAMADFHRKKGYLCNDENAIIYEEEIKKLFGIKFSTINLSNGFIIECADKYIYLTSQSFDTIISIDQADKSRLSSSTFNPQKPVYAFQSKDEIKRGNKKFYVSKLRAGCDYLFEFRGIYDSTGKLISDFGVL